MTRFSDRFSLRTKMFAGGLGLLLIGAAAGSVLSMARHPVPAMAPAAPQSIATALTATNSGFARAIVTVRGQVTGVFGNSFTLRDTSGQTLIQLGGKHGGAGDPTTLVSVGQTVTAQGFVDNGAIRPQFLITADGKAWAVGGHHGFDGRGHGGHRHGEDDRQLANPAPSPTPATVAPVAKP